MNINFEKIKEFLLDPFLLNLIVMVTSIILATSYAENDNGFLSFLWSLVAITNICVFYIDNKSNKTPKLFT